MRLKKAQVKPKKLKEDTQVETKKTKQDNSTPARVEKKKNWKKLMSMMVGKGGKGGLQKFEPNHQGVTEYKRLKTVGSREAMSKFMAKWNANPTWEFLRQWRMDTTSFIDDHELQVKWLTMKQMRDVYGRKEANRLAAEKTRDGKTKKDPHNTHRSSTS